MWKIKWNCLAAISENSYSCSTYTYLPTVHWCARSLDKIVRCECRCDVAVSNISFIQLSLPIDIMRLWRLCWFIVDFDIERNTSKSLYSLKWFSINWNLTFCQHVLIFSIKHLLLIQKECANIDGNLSIVLYKILRYSTSVQLEYVDILLSMRIFNWINQLVAIVLKEQRYYYIRIAAACQRP